MALFLLGGGVWSCGGEWRGEIGRRAIAIGSLNVSAAIIGRGAAQLHCRDAVGPVQRKVTADPSPTKSRRSLPGNNTPRDLAMDPTCI